MSISVSIASAVLLISIAAFAALMPGTRDWRLMLPAILVGAAASFVLSWRAQPFARGLARWLADQLMAWSSPRR